MRNSFIVLSMFLFSTFVSVPVNADEQASQERLSGVAAIPALASRDQVAVGRVATDKVTRVKDASDQFGSEKATVEMEKGATDKNFGSELTDSLASQARLLIEINTALIHGSVSAQDSADLRRAVEVAAQREDRYLATGTAVPVPVLAHESRVLNAIQSQLEQLEQTTEAQQLAGSAAQQDVVKASLNQCLTEGRLSAEDANKLEKKVDTICAEESWYLMNEGGSIPQQVVEKDQEALNQMETNLKGNLIGGKTGNAL